VLLERTLTKAGVAHVYTTGEPGSVVSLYQQLKPDLVLLDLHMPGMDGVAVMEALAAAMPADDFVPVIVLTADATQQARDRVLAAGANDFLTKPVDRIEVVLRVRNLLHSRALHARLHEHNARLQDEITERREADERARAATTDKTRRVQAVLDTGPPRVVFQPICDLSSGAAVGYEALARFDGEPRRPPDHWFKEAAEVGRGPALELAATGAALDQLDAVPSSAFLTLNVSPTSACTPELAALLARYPGRRLVLEVTEHVRVDDYGLLLDALVRLRRTGVRLAVDDAGAGFASLHHILQLCPDIIKLDIALTRSIDQDPVKRALASCLVSFSRDIGGLLIAEGIETSGEQATLTELGVPWGQGFHLGYPDDLPVGGASATA
jgi:EAL domain-containing protein (putative c-di-GMP-specific phosphodiesterase class I)/FixJ family two-component response regulator